ncbi:hypothetical protein D5S17_23385 [Pseudonocardiaceae bacterium YIM PH 21723]|nr:hypothetical protein D5S17_23385 [Pseudonocardiaceae bacterium YIM PH 21723]
MSVTTDRRKLPAALLERCQTITTLLISLGFTAEHAHEAEQWVTDTLRDACLGFGDCLHRADWMETLRGNRYDGQETQLALTALNRIEQDVLGGVRIPPTDIKHRFHPTRLSIWDRELNRYFCHECQIWVTNDGDPDLLYTKYCPAGHVVSP